MKVSKYIGIFLLSLMPALAFAGGLKGPLFSEKQISIFFLLVFNYFFSVWLSRISTRERMVFGVYLSVILGSVYIVLWSIMVYRFLSEGGSLNNNGVLLISFLIALYPFVRTLNNLYKFHNYKETKQIEAED